MLIVLKVRSRGANLISHTTFTDVCVCVSWTITYAKSRVERAKGKGVGNVFYGPVSDLICRTEEINEKPAVKFDLV
jgi:hypothetical protein